MSFAERNPRDREAEIRHLAMSSTGCSRRSRLSPSGISLRRSVAASAPRDGNGSSHASIGWSAHGALVDRLRSRHVSGPGLRRSCHTRPPPCSGTSNGISTWRIHVTAPPSCRVRSVKVVIHRGTVDGVDRTRLDAIPITTATRTLIDCAPELDDEVLEAALEDCLHRGLFTQRFLARRLQELASKGRAGVPRLRTILDRRRGEARSSRASR
jgi:hypothetical protein